jgi:hypothetical protein
MFFTVRYNTVLSNVLLSPTHAFGGNSIDSEKVFLQQKRIIRTITGSSSRTSCKFYFRD